MHYKNIKISKISKKRVKLKLSFKLKIFHLKRSAGCTVYELLTLEIYFLRKKLHKNESHLKELNQILEL